MRARTYVFCLFACAVVIAGTPALVNLYADPYGLRGATVTPERYRPNAIIRDERTAKILRSRLGSADVVLLGTSRTAIGLDPRDAFFGGKRVYNLAFGGQSLRETRMLLENVVPAMGATDVYVGLDLFAANVHFTGKENLTAHLAGASAAGAAVETIVSWQTFQHSRALLAGETAYSAERAGIYDSVNGSLQWSPAYARAQGGPRAMFQISERAYITDNYRPAPSRAFALSRTSPSRETREEFSLLLRAAYRHNIRLHLFISPSHARQWTTLASAGLWDHFEQWKILLATTVEAEARAHQRPAFVVWDFADYSSPELEHVPAGMDPMRNYWDSSHYRPELGTALLARMRDGTQANADFGAPLVTTTLDSHLQRIRSRRAAYETAQPDDVREIQEITRRILEGTRSASPAPGKRSAP